MVKDKILMAMRSERTRKVLLALNLIMALGVFLLFNDHPISDKSTYLGLADGILHGRYSFWWHLPVEVPDTFRNPGYPLFLAMFRAFTTSELPIQIAQLILYCLSVLFVLRSMRALQGTLIAGNIFLLLLLPSINIAYFNTGIYPEPLSLFLISAFVLVETTWDRSWKRTLVLALLAGAAFQCRSSLLLFPLFWAFGRWYVERDRKVGREIVLMLSVFVLTTLPYSFWNLHNHGVFKPTPLEGGGGVMHVGWWSGKIPGHTEKWYWGNFVNEEMVAFTDPAQVPANIAAFNAEWARIDSSLRPLITAKDSIMLEAYGPKKKLLRTFNADYTLAREKALKTITVEHMLAEPWYTIGHKTYSAVRLWVTGINMQRLSTASFKGMVLELYPFILTLSIFLLAVVLVPITLWKDRVLLKRCIPLLVWIIYYGSVHIPFVIQARYTIPVRLLLLATIALCLERLVADRSPRTKAIDGTVPE